MLGLLQSRKESTLRKIESDCKTGPNRDRSSVDAREVKQGEVEPLLVASIHQVRCYEDRGELFGMIGRRFGQQIYGNPASVVRSMSRFASRLGTVLHCSGWFLGTDHDASKSVLPLVAS